MALIKCPECASEISDKAPSCPKCGVPLASASAQQAPPQYQQTYEPNPQYQRTYERPGAQTQAETIEAKREKAMPLVHQLASKVTTLGVIWVVVGSLQLCVAGYILYQASSIYSYSILKDLSDTLLQNGLIISAVATINIIFALFKFRYSSNLPKKSEFILSDFEPLGGKVFNLIWNILVMISGLMAFGAIVYGIIFVIIGLLGVAGSVYTLSVRSFVMSNKLQFELFLLDTVGGDDPWNNPQMHELLKMVETGKFVEADWVCIKDGKNYHIVTYEDAKVEFGNDKSVKNVTIVRKEHLLSIQKPFLLSHDVIANFYVKDNVIHVVESLADYVPEGRYLCY